MPRAVVFATTHIGGIGLLDLFTEQGSSKVTTKISHIRSKSPLYTPLIVLIETYQVLAGMTKPALEDTTPHIYVQSPWMSCTREYLHHIKGQIIIPEIESINIIRQHDSAIMENPATHVFTKSQLEAINACRIFLQVNTIAEISSCKGTVLLQCAVKGTTDATQTPMILTQMASSTKTTTNIMVPVETIFKKLYNQHSSTPTNTTIGTLVQQHST
jgi:hypothetical protein